MLQSNTPYTIAYKQDGIFLTVNTSDRIDRNAILEQVVKALAQKGITDINKQSLMLVINNSSGMETKIAETLKGIATDAEIKINISSDKMKASLVLTPPKAGNELSGSQIMDIIRSKGIIYGVDNLLVSKLGSTPVYNENIEFAKGQESVKGEDGILELLFNVSEDKKPKILEDGSVDFRELNYIVGVKTGDVLGKIIPPQDGIPGKNVLGQTLPAGRGKPARNPKGKNVELVDNEKKVVAKLDGYASFVDNRINVLNVIDIPADVDVSTGNIRFTGNVVVRGNVRSDFVIEATGTIEVYGVVEGAILKAEGDIILKRGMQGGNRGQLISGGDVVARFIEHSTIVAKNNIKTESIMHCSVNCGGSIELLGLKGLIVGGNIKVQKQIDAKIIGSSMATPTNIEIGIDPEKRNKYRKIKDRFEEVRKALNEMDKSIEILCVMKQKNTITLQKKIMLVKLVQSKQPLSEEFDVLKEEIENLEEEFTTINTSKIKVKNRIYPGVKVTIGSISKFIKEIEEFVTISLDGADIKMTPYQ